MTYYLSSHRSGRGYVVIRWHWEIRIPVPRWLYKRLQKRRSR
jgi:hypothetical protein